MKTNPMIREEYAASTGGGAHAARKQIRMGRPSMVGRPEKACVLDAWISARLHTRTESRYA